MKIRKKIYFSQKYKFNEINWDNQDNLIKVFQDIVESFYLKPAKLLNNYKYGFAAGAICLITIDFLARIETGSNHVRERFEKWVKCNIKEFNKTDINNPSRTLAYRLFEDFRNGLVHEGRIKKASQFSYDSHELVEIDQSIMINPRYLLNAIIKSFKKYINKLKTNKYTFDNFKKNLEKDFHEDMKYVNK